jgi:hypothetical protein
VSNTPGLLLSQTGTQSVTNTPSNNPQLVSANAANAANTASNNIGIIVGSATGGALLGMIATILVSYHMANRPRRIASPPLYPASHTTMNIPHAYFQEDVEAAPAMIARPRTFSVPPINNQKVPKFLSPSTRNVFSPTQVQGAAVHNPFEAKFHVPPPPPPPEN